MGVVERRKTTPFEYSGRATRRRSDRVGCNRRAAFPI
jgi:hypothetical protein